MDVEYNANQYKQQGNQAYKKQDYRKAITCYSNAIRQNPKQSTYYLNRALCHFNLKNYLECINDCNKSLQLNPEYVKAYIKKSNAFVKLLKLDEALTAIKQAYNFEKTQKNKNQIQEIEHLLSNLQKFTSAFKSDDYAEALSCVSHLVSKIPDNNDLRMSKIECLAKTGATDQALKQLKSIPDVKNPETLYLRGIIQLYSGDSLKAKNYFSQGIKLDPQNAKCQKALNRAKKCEKFKQEGNALIKASKWAQAEAKYTQALNLDPFNKKLNSIIYSNRALTYMKRKQFLKAAQDLNKSIELNPNYLKSYVKRAQVNMERGEFSQAISDYGKIQQLDPTVNLTQKIKIAKKKQKQAKKKDYYAILGVPKTASQADIKKAYKSLALKYHPDRNRNKTEVQQEQASKKFKDIVQANGVLTDAQKKKMYDSGQMQYDGDTGADFEDMRSNNMGGGMGGFSNMGGFQNCGNMKFNMNSNSNGQNMGNIDPNEIFSMFMGSGGLGGFGGGFGQNKGKKTKMNMDQFGGFGGFDFGNMGGNMGGNMEGLPQNFRQQKAQSNKASK